MKRRFSPRQSPILPVGPADCSPTVGRRAVPARSAFEVGFADERAPYAREIHRLGNDGAFPSNRNEEISIPPGAVAVAAPGDRSRSGCLSNLPWVVTPFDASGKLFFGGKRGFDPVAMSPKPTSADLKFRAFSDLTRIRILHLLLEGELCVCDIVHIIRVPQPTASRHLSYLRGAGLVTTKKKGLWTFYSLAPVKTKFEGKLRGCLAHCFDEIAEVRNDKARWKKLRKRGGGC